MRWLRSIGGRHLVPLILAIVVLSVIPSITLAFSSEVCNESFAAFEKGDVLDHPEIQTLSEVLGTPTVSVKGPCLLDGKTDVASFDASPVFTLPTSMSAFNLSYTFELNVHWSEGNIQWLNIYANEWEEISASTILSGLNDSIQFSEIKLKSIDENISVSAFKIDWQAVKVSSPGHEITFDRVDRNMRGYTYSHQANSTLFPDIQDAHEAVEILILDPGASLENCTIDPDGLTRFGGGGFIVEVACLRHQTEVEVIRGEDGTWVAAEVPPFTDYYSVFPFDIYGLACGVLILIPILLYVGVKLWGRRRKGGSE